MAYVVKSELPAELQSAVYFGLGTADNSFTFDRLRSMFIERNKNISPGKLRNETEIDSYDGMCSTRLFEDTFAVITLHAVNGRVIGLRLVEPHEFVSGDPHFIEFEFSYSGAYELPTGSGPFLVKRYINGVEDTSYVSPKGGPYGSNGEAGINLRVFYYTPVLFVKDNSVTYEVVDLDSSIKKNITQKVYYAR